MRRLGHLKLLIGGVGAALLLLGLSPAGASSANISHSYASSADITNGSLVSLDSSQSNYVVAANSQNGQQLLGVAVASDDSLLAVDATAGATQVATSGIANALVSTINGAISVGDQVSVSPFNGVGMKAEPGSHVIGLAQTAFSSASTGATSETVSDKRGKQTRIVVGYVRLGIAVGTASTQGSDVNLNGLQRLAKALTGHTVSTARTVMSLAVTLVAFVALITLIYGSIYGGIISIGRNPLAKYAIFRSLSVILLMVGITALIAGLTIYYLLR